MDFQQHSDYYSNANYPIYPAPINHLPPTPNDDYPPVGDHFHTVPPQPHSILTQTQDDSFGNIYYEPQVPYAGHVKPSHTPISPYHEINKTPTITPNISNNPFPEPPLEANDPFRQGSNSDDEDRTPAQQRRKAQNRAAQRAFRERKDRHVRDLETKLASLEKSSASVMEENERLKLQLQKKDTENEILRVTSNRNGSEALPDAGPMRYSPTDFYTELLYAHDNKTPSHRIVTSETGERLLAAGATWDYIIKHDLYVRGLVDVGDVSERLKRVAKCDGQGPVFEESQILLAIQQSVASGSDELM
ncbi:hypothetical protein HYALB_00001447 [Hymenoscyphus albidus]|uniref:BZIP domain-containing protein n=1 Tax=Hymenoscyphus albidus TaxID=595503 RepID=A0A9N9Q2Q3_9HELO|nr:hypothetical protein HYALB_00001447 [Hymenoscyphus albidus]